jgi:hypothetical protein
VAATDRRSSGTSAPSGPIWRWALAAVLIAGILWVALRHPAVPAESWPAPNVYTPEETVCREARAGRQWTTYRVPDAMEAPEGVTVAEVARRFNLEPAPVCRANGMDEVGFCGETQVEPGRELMLPLTDDPAAVTAALDALRDREGD